MSMVPVHAMSYFLGNVAFVVAPLLLFGLSVVARVFLGISATTATIECRSRKQK